MLTFCIKNKNKQNLENRQRTHSSCSNVLPAQLGVIIPLSPESYAYIFFTSLSYYMLKAHARD